MPRSGRKLKIAGNSLRSGEAPPSSRFNEAGAIMPRSGRSAPEMAIFAVDAEAGAIMPRSGAMEWFRVVKRSFNEAGAIMPRSGWPAGEPEGLAASRRLQ